MKASSIPHGIGDVFFKRNLVQPMQTTIIILYFWNLNAQYQIQ